MSHFLMKNDPRSAIFLALPRRGLKSFLRYITVAAGLLQLTLFFSHNWHVYVVFFFGSRENVSSARGVVLQRLAQILGMCEVCGAASGYGALTSQSTKKARRKL